MAITTLVPQPGCPVRWCAGNQTIAHQSPEKTAIATAGHAARDDERRLSRTASTSDRRATTLAGVGSAFYGGGSDVATRPEDHGEEMPENPLGCFRRRKIIDRASLLWRPQRDSNPRPLTGGAPGAPASPACARRRRAAG